MPRPFESRNHSPAPPDNAVNHPVAVEIPLPGGKQAVGVVERSRLDANGNCQMTENRLTTPAKDRFLFVRQPEGTPSGAFCGVMRFPNED